MHITLRLDAMCVSSLAVAIVQTTAEPVLRHHTMKTTYRFSFSDVFIFCAVYLFLLLLKSCHYLEFSHKEDKQYTYICT